MGGGHRVAFVVEESVPRLVAAASRYVGPRVEKWFQDRGTVFFGDKNEMCTIRSTIFDVQHI